MSSYGQLPQSMTLLQRINLIASAAFALYRRINNRISKFDKEVLQ